MKDMLDTHHLTLLAVILSMLSRAASRALCALKVTLDNMLKMTFNIVA